MIYNNSMRCAFLLLLFFSANTWSSPAEEPEEFSIPILDSAQSLLGERMNFVANRIDSFFATQRADDELGRSVIRIRERYSIRERALPDQQRQFRFNLRLPHLEEKFHLSYFEEKKKAKEGADPATVENPTVKELETDWLFRSDVGLVVSYPPVVFTRARLRRSFYTGTLIHRFSEELAWYSDERGAIEETRFDTDHSFSPTLLFRFVNQKEWRITNKDFNTSHGPTLFHLISEKDAFSYSFITSTTIVDGVWFLSNHSLSLTYRRNLYKNWLFIDITPGIDFPKEWSFRRTPFVNFQLEALFGS